MENLSGVVIMNHWKRNLEGRVTQKLVRRQCDPAGLEVALSYDDGSLGVLKNMCQALAMPLEKKTGWRLIIHDDVMAPRGVFGKVNYIMGHMPKATFASAYCPSNNGYDEAFENRHHIMLTSTNIWAQALLFPEIAIPKFLQFVNERVRPDYPWDDRVVSAYLQVKGLKCHCIVPSLFQHLGAYRSTLGFPGKVGMRYRYSEHYDPNFDPTKVHWESHIFHAARNETMVNLKDILI